MKPTAKAKKATADKPSNEASRTSVHYNAILCSPTLLCEGVDKLPSNPLGLNLSAIVGLVCGKGHADTKGIVTSQVSSPLEFYVRTMLCACAQTVSIPAYGRSMWATPQQIKALLSETVSSRLKFVDRSHTIWSAVERYLTPILLDLRKGISESDFDRIEGRKLDAIAWDLYLLFLSVRGHSEVPINPGRTLVAIDSLNKESCLGAESRARLAIIRGLFGVFKKSADVPGFRCVLNGGQSLRERLDDIADDAYLLDASRLRRFFGFQSNIRSIRKDLLKLVAFIVRNRKWAKGAVMATSHATVLPTSSAEVLDKAFELFPEHTSNSAAPVLIDPDCLFEGLGKMFVLSSQRMPFRSAEQWSVSIRASKGELCKSAGPDRLFR